jgi:hypothetical protein
MVNAFEKEYPEMFKTSGKKKKLSCSCIASKERLGLWLIETAEHVKVGETVAVEFPEGDIKIIYFEIAE